MPAILMIEAAITVSVPGEWASFERSAKKGPNKETASVSFSDTTKQDAALHRKTFKIRYTRRSAVGTEVFETSSEKCPIMRSILRDLAETPIPAPYIWGLDTDTVDTFVFDGGTDYTLTVPSHMLGGKLRVESAADTPLAKAITTAFAAIKPCWSGIAPISSIK